MKDVNVTIVDAALIILLVNIWADPVYSSCPYGVQDAYRGPNLGKNRNWEMGSFSFLIQLIPDNN